MTVTTTASTTRFSSGGPDFPVPFRFLKNADITARLILADGTTETLVEGGQYTLTGAGASNGGTLTSSYATSVLDAGGARFVISRIILPTQETDLRNQGKYLAETQETALDKLTMLAQQALAANDQVMSFPVTDPEGLSQTLPSQAARAGKVAAFNSSGEPIASALSLQQLEQQPALALASAQAAAASAGQAAGSASAAAGSASAAAASAASVTGAAVPMFFVGWWPGTRASIPAGWVPADGQTLNRALYPDAWAAINDGSMPTTPDATWLSTPGEKGKYTAGDGSTTFRVPDYNGKSAGSIGPLMTRGDGVAGFATGAIRQDQIQNITGEASFAVTSGIIAASGAATGAFKKGTAQGNWVSSTSPLASNNLAFDASGSVRTGTETFPTHVIGCMIIKLFGAVTNQGAADAAALATALATLSADFQSSRAGSFANTFLSVEDRKATNTSGGTATAATWTTRDLNSVRVNRIGGASVASNQITLPAGTYRFEARAPAIGVGAHQIRLRNITDAADVDTGSSGFSISSALNAQTDSVISGEFTIAATKVFEIQHNVAVTRATNGFGAAANLGTTEIYTQARFWRLA